MSIDDLMQQAQEAEIRTKVGNLSRLSPVVLAAQAGGEVHCLHVFSPPGQRLHPHEPSGEATGEVETPHLAAWQERLEQFVDRHEGVSLRCVLFPWSNHGRGIAQYAREIKADLVILGTHGHTTLRHLLLGSTAERLLCEVSCSVLTVRPRKSELLAPLPGAEAAHTDKPAKAHALAP